MNEPAPSVPKLSPDTFDQITEQLAKLGNDNLAELIEIEHLSTKLPKDEVWKLYACDLYERAIKHPTNHQLHKDDAAKILGCLNQISDEGLAQEWLGMRQHYRPGRVDNIANTLARMIQVLVKRRGLSSLVSDLERKPSKN